MARLLNAKWLNQDEFSHLNRGAKTAFLTALSESSVSTFPNSVLIVDRINTTVAHRSDIFGAMLSPGIRVGILWEVPVPECIVRIKQRSFGHKSILPGAPVGTIVGRTAKEYVPISIGEMDAYGVCKLIKISGSPSREKVVELILRELDTIPELGFLNISSITDQDIRMAIKVSADRESAIAQAMAPAAPLVNLLPSIPKRVFPDVIEGRYEIHFTTNPFRFTEIFNFLNNSSDEQKCKSDFHLTLLYINKELARSINESKTGSAEYRRAIAGYKRTQSPIGVKIEYVAKNEHVTAVKCTIQTSKLKFFNVIPHVSLGKTDSAQFRECNELIEQVEQFRQRDGNIGKRDNTEWIDLTNDETLVHGTLRFARHGQK